MNSDRDKGCKCHIYMMFVMVMKELPLKQQFPISFKTKNEIMITSSSLMLLRCVVPMTVVVIVIHVIKLHRKHYQFI